MEAAAGDLHLHTTCLGRDKELCVIITSRGIESTVRWFHSILKDNRRSLTFHCAFLSFLAPSPPRIPSSSTSPGERI
eukprot:760284-Hanusia_phi.AAC.1